VTTRIVVPAVALTALVFEVVVAIETIEVAVTIGLETTYLTLSRADGYES